MAKARLITLPGHHHLHMDNPQPVASSIIEFIKNAVETPG